MNIFASDPCPVKSGVVLDDQRLVKMILESAQMLGTVFNEQGVSHPYRFLGSHAKHPCTVWVRESYGNVEWLVAHMLAMHLEYERRFDKQHRSAQVTSEAFDRYLRVTTSRAAMTTPANAARRRDLNLDFTMYPVHEAYKRYLLARWALSSPRWKLPPPYSFSSSSSDLS